MDARRCMYSSRIMDSEEVDVISVTDVYDQAAGIAHEFDKLIHNYGNDSVTELMPRVIKSLEQLETLASRYERDAEVINQLRYKVEKLETEKAGKAQERAKYDQELETIEENWQSEVKELLSVVNRLQDENKRLRDHARSEKHAVVAEFVAKRQETEEEEIKVLTKLKETVDKQREELRNMKRELSQKGVDCDALQAQLERIAKVNADLRRKNTTQKKQAQVLLQEKLELETQLHTKDNEVEHIKKLMSEQERYDEQRAAVKEAIAAGRSIEEEDESENKEDSDKPLKAEMARTRGISSSIETDSEHGSQVASPGSPTTTFDLDGKLVIDLKDPNRPRFTLQELRQVLMERNELKTRLIEVEEELGHYKPKDELNTNTDAKDAEAERSSYMGEEVLVYGPINREPDEKIGIKKESGIRKLKNQTNGQVVSPEAILTPDMFTLRFWFFIFGWFTSGTEVTAEDEHSSSVDDNRIKAASAHSQHFSSRSFHTGPKPNLVRRQFDNFDEAVCTDADNTEDECFCDVHYDGGNENHFRSQLGCHQPAALWELSES